MASDQAFNHGVPPKILNDVMKPYNKTKTALRYDDDWPGVDRLQEALTELHPNMNLPNWQNLTWLECFDKITKTETYTDQRHFMMFTSYEPPTNESSIIGLAVLSGVNYGTQRPVAICPPTYLQSTPGFSEPAAYGVNPKTSKIKKGGKKVGSAMCWPYWNGTSTRLRKDNLNSDRFTGYDPATDLQLRYCFREVVEPQCALYYSPLITLIVAVVAGAQALLMTVSLIVTTETPLVLLGDVIASYLKHPDIHTEPSGGHFEARPNERVNVSSQSQVHFSAWASVSIFLAVQLVVLISWGSTTMEKPGLFGADKNPARWFIAPICISGAIQLVLVVRGYLENVMATAIRTSDDFHQFENRRTTLRVSSPKPSLSNPQKAAYVLQMPVGAAIWHIATNAFIHWWVSLYFSVQLFMVIRLDGASDYPELSARPNYVLVRCFAEVFSWFIKIFTGAFSAAGSRTGSSGSEFLGILFLIIVIPFTAALVVIFAGPLLLHAGAVLLLMNKRRKERVNSIIGEGTDSWDVSIACHSPPEEGDISEKNIKWGYTSQQTAGGSYILAFSSRTVNGASAPATRDVTSQAQGDRLPSDDVVSMENADGGAESALPLLTLSQSRRNTRRRSDSVYLASLSRQATRGSSTSDVVSADVNPTEGIGAGRSEFHNQPIASPDVARYRYA